MIVTIYNMYWFSIYIRYQFTVQLSCFFTTNRLTISREREREREARRCVLYWVSQQNTLKNGLRIMYSSLFEWKHSHPSKNLYQNLSECLWWDKNKMQRICYFILFLTFFSRVNLSSPSTVDEAVNFENIVFYRWVKRFWLWYLQKFWATRTVMLLFLYRPELGETS